MRTTFGLALCLAIACGGNSSGGVDSGPTTADAAPDASTDAAVPTMCDQGYQLLPANSVGAMVASNSRDPLSELEAGLARTALILDGQPWGRDVNHETQLHEIRYTTQDRGQLVEATGYVIAPVVDALEEFPVLLMMHGTTGVSDQCAPSRNLDDDESDNFGLALILSLIASNGYIVVAPDYIGLKASGDPSTALHPYLVGEAAAIGAWDAVRASDDHLASLGSTMATMGPIAVWGASQGGHAGAFAVRYAPTYAPELNVVAGVYNVPPLALGQQWQAALSTPQSATGNIAVAFAAMAEWYPAGGVADVFAAPFDTVLPTELRAGCDSDALDGVTTLEELFVADILSANDDPFLGGDHKWSCAIRDNDIDGTRVPRTDTVPSLVVTAELDPLVNTAIERQAFDARCASGDYSDWRYLECEGANHGEGFLWAIDDSLDFIDARVAGQPLGGACATAAPVQCSNTP